MTKFVKLKESAVLALSKKHCQGDAEIQSVASENGLKTSQLKRAWEVSRQYGEVSLSRTHLINIDYPKFSSNNTKNIYGKYPFKKYKEEEAANLILKFINFKGRTYTFLKLYKLSGIQFYGWLREISEKHSLLGEHIAALNSIKLPFRLVDVIRYYKHPEYIRKRGCKISTLTKSEKAVYNIIIKKLISSLGEDPNDVKKAFATIARRKK